MMAANSSNKQSAEDLAEVLDTYGVDSSATKVAEDGWVVDIWENSDWLVASITSWTISPAMFEYLKQDQV